MFEAPDSPYLVGFDQPFDIADAPTAPPPDAPGKRACKERLAAAVERIAELQPILYAHDRHAVLLIFQALDAAGKDGTIRALLQGVNPAGCVVHNFRVPSDEELDHDFLWRTTLRLPARGMIGVFNRSYYEEVLVVRVHPEFLAAQNLPDDVGQNLPDEVDQKNIWQERYQSMCEHELHLARNGTVIVKFFLHVSRDEQRRRFLARIDEPEKNWKFAERDVREREHWSDYMSAYADTLGATARPWAPWYAVPADDKPFLRMTVAEVVAAALGRLNLHYPRVRESDRERFAEMRTLLVEESD